MAIENKPDTAIAQAMQKAEYQSEGGEISKRGPGRPPKTTAGIGNTVDTYTPTPERNNRDQALQPTGDGDIAGKGAEMADEQAHAEAFGGKGDHDNDGHPGGNAVSKFFPVTLKRNYRPLTDNWRIVKDDGSYGPKPQFEDGTTPKVMAGFKIALPIEEAKGIIAKGVAERADAIE